jgi:hypothetical protein
VIRLQHTSTATTLHRPIRHTAPGRSTRRTVGKRVMIVSSAHRRAEGPATRTNVMGAMVSVEGRALDGDMIEMTREKAGL